MDARKNIRNLVLQGEIDAAIAEVKKLEPKLFEENEELYFDLQLQKLIEMIKTDDLIEALQFSAKTIIPYIAAHEPTSQENYRKLEKIMSLMAFRTPSHSPMSHLIESSQKVKTASKLNSVLLEARDLETESKLPTLLKLLLWSQNQLAETVNFPQITDLA